MTLWKDEKPEVEERDVRRLRRTGSVLLVGNFSSSSNCLGLDLADRLTGKGWDVLVASRADSGIGRCADMGATILREQRRYQLAQVDVYSGQAFRWAEMSCAMLRRLNKPYILSLHGGGLPGFGSREPDRVAHLLQSAHAVTTPSSYLRREMSGYRSDLRLLPNARDLNLYRNRVRRGASPRLVWVRRFDEIYNPTLAIQVMERVVRRYPTASLTMAGPDSGDGTLRATKKLVKDLGLVDRVHFRGAVSRREVPDLLDEADIFLNTTDVDNTPLSILEAMASGMCIVSTNAGGLPDLLKNEADALLVPPNEPDTMAEAVTRILDDASLAEWLSLWARRSVRRFDWKVILPIWESLLAGVARGGGMRTGCRSMGDILIDIPSRRPIL